MRVDLNRPAMRGRFLHRRGAENAEVSRRGEGRGKEKKENRLLSSISSSSLLLSAKPLRSLRLCGEWDFIKHCLILPIILLPALLIALPAGEAQSQRGANAQQDRSWNRRVAGAGDYQIVLEVSGRVEVSRFFKMPDPLDLRSICDAKLEAERRAILSSESYLNTLSQAGDRRQYEIQMAQLRNELGQLYAYRGEMAKSVEHFEAAYELIRSIAPAHPEF